MKKRIDKGKERKRKARSKILDGMRGKRRLKKNKGSERKLSAHVFSS